MLKNELDKLATNLIPENFGIKVASFSDCTFSKVISKSCGNVREAWASAAFSQSNDDTLHRYFDFHFKFLSGLIAENNIRFENEVSLEILLLMDHLLHFYGKFIDRKQHVCSQYFSYRLKLLQPVHRQFWEQVEKAKINKSLLECLNVCLSPLYNGSQIDGQSLDTLFYRENLLNALVIRNEIATKDKDERLISVLMIFNFNNFHFYRFLREGATLKANEINQSDRGKYFLELSAAVPLVSKENHPSFDKRWPHICNAYKGWLTEQGTLLNLACPIDESNKPLRKVPLNISVKYLGCMIRALHESGFYGTVSLSDIFDNAVASFTTKRQGQISRDSLSNAFYNISQPTAGRMIHIFNNSATFLKSHYFPV